MYTSQIQNEHRFNSAFWFLEGQSEVDRPGTALAWGPGAARPALALPWWPSARAPCVYLTLDITRLSESLHLVYDPRLLCPLMLGISHETSCMG